MEDTTNSSSTVEQDSSATTEQTIETKTDNSADNTAYKELYTEQTKKLEAMQKEIADLKVANAKLAIQQSATEPLQTAEELLNKMF